ncbi:MAG: DNA primase [Gammaproteobacteria bacterium]|nr:DNA primase [Gammaproteobacteria bacterium]
MAGKIPREFIDDLMSRVDIVDVIDERVPLKKAGKEYKACCPFHDEKTPSFTVSQSKQFYHCFGCGAHGTALGFLMEYDHMGFVEAVEDLASRAGMEVPREQGPAGEREQQGPDLGSLYDVLARADGFYRKQLREHPQAARAVDYLKQRGLTGNIAAEFGIGYAPPGWDALLALHANKSEQVESFITAGMLIKKDSGGSYDRFRDRIMFPIRDVRGRTIAFGGRVLPDSGEAEKGAKYLNSPETPVFHKGRELYGLYEARKAVRKLERLVVVEGYMDVVALAQHGIRYAVATLGTATTAEHLNRLFRLVDEVVFCFDGDRAGREAAWRALDNALPVMREGRQLRFMFLPEGEDPDTLVRQQGAEGFEQHLKKALSFSEYFFEVLTADVDIGSIDGRARLVEKARPLMARIPQGVLRSMLGQHLAKLSQMEPNQLGAVLGSGASTSPASRPVPPRAGRRKDAPSPVRTIIKGLLNHPVLALHAGPAQRFVELQQAGVELMVEMLEMVQADPNVNSAVLLEHWRDTEHERALYRLAADETILDTEQMEADFLGALALLDRQRLEQRRDFLIQKSIHGGLNEEEKEEMRRLFTDQRTT